MKCICSFMALISNNLDCLSEENARVIYKEKPNPVTHGVTILCNNKVNLASPHPDLRATLGYRLSYHSHPPDRQGSPGSSSPPTMPLPGRAAGMGMGITWFRGPWCWGVSRLLLAVASLVEECRL